VLNCASTYTAVVLRPGHRKNRAVGPASLEGGRACPVGAGLKRYDFSQAAARIADALFDTGTAARDFRLPELFCGFDHAAAGRGMAYPVACISQAWAAAASFLLLQAMLGVAARAPDGALAISKPVSAGLAIARRATPSASRRGGREPRLRTGRWCHRILPAGTGRPIRVTMTVRAPLGEPVPAASRRAHDR
jgi:hypothetical protein